ncbi:N-acyl-D-amino-acid deacylase family protein [Paratissierella segnis]|uniref:Amidohydrolase family protein n=1 Tax=Paratissierella segnis TaxID=2763679 RepID=A0A926EUV0_9FIRM|nr:amidohydrolase family protein [Paratissierella segnis]MBC8586987.1 amidohydrolase family protein [Paratissierella segnis]
MYDVVIRNGLIVDGTGKKPYKGDIAIEGDRIEKISNSIDEKGVREIDATGRMVIPGLIDPHVHEEWICLIDGTYEYCLRQGVTTVVNGNCGHSIVPGPTEKIIDYYWGNGLMSTKQRDEYKKSFPKWNDFKGYAEAVQEKGSTLNFVTLMGHGTIRWAVMDGAHNRPPSEDEKKEIESILRHNMEQGAWGISFGLDYVPSRYADIDELTDVAKIIEEYDGVAAAHLRHMIGIKEATEEFIEVGKRSGVKIQVSHLKSTCPEAFDVALNAAKDGLRVLVDTIPLSTGHCTSKSRLIQFVMAISDDLFSKGEEGVKAALKTKEGRETIKKDAYIFAGDKSDKFIINSDIPELEYRSIQDIADERNQDPDECILDLLADDNNYTFWLGGRIRPDFPKNGHVQSIIDNPYVCVGTDEILGDPEDPFDWYELLRRGGFPIFANMYLEKGVPYEEIVRRNTSMVAKHFGIEKRGELKEGYFADISIIDLENYNFPSPDEVDYKKPLTVATGVDYVIVNGQLTIYEGNLTNTFSGRVLKKI